MELAPGRRSTVELGRLEQKLNSLDAQISRGVDNLLCAAPRSVESAATRLSEWQAIRDELARQIETHKSATPKAVEAMLGNVMAEIRALRIGLASKERGLLHHTLQQLVKMITL